MGWKVIDRGYKRLVTILIGLCTVAVFLAVAITVINTTSRQMTAQTDYNEAKAALPEELKGGDLSPEDKVIKDTSIMFGDPNYSTDDILAYYDNVISNAVKDGDSSFAIKIIIQKMDFIAVSLGNCDAALSFVDDLDLTPFSTNDVSYLASYVLSAAYTCENQEAIDLWGRIYEESVEE